MKYNIKANEHFTITQGNTTVNVDELKNYIDTNIGDIETLLSNI